MAAPVQKARMAARIGIGPVLEQLTVQQSFWLELLGRAHVAIVHFPIALLMLAGLIEAWGLVTRRKERSRTTVVLLTVGTAAVVAAAVSGWFHAGPGPLSRNVTIHLAAGIITAAVALTALLGVVLGKAALARAMTILAAVSVAAAGHFGGELTHGEGYLTAGLFPEKPSNTISASVIPASAANHDPASVAVASQIEAEYETKVRPILAAACFECHSASKQSGALRLDSVEQIHAGGKSGVVIVAGRSDQSLLIQRVLGHGGMKRMPMDREPLSDEQIAVLREWIDRNRLAPPVVQQKWVAKVEPVRPKVASPVDLILEPYYKSHDITPGDAVTDRIYARRVYLDVVGMLPSIAELKAFEADDHPDKRNRLVRQLLADNQRYAENWMTFWNDALRNDYQGTGYIDGGREQITTWLYSALANNMPYDRFVRELINPVDGSTGFTKGIVWRGAVSQSQRPEMQAAQNISQVFLGINMKCASCHDSFINDLKLTDAYGMASVYAEQPLEIYRCEKETGETSRAKFLYEQLGTIDPEAPREQRMQQLAELMTSPDNGRLARTIVNRLWTRFMGRGLVEPLDEMDNVPWNEDLLDWLAIDLIDNGYDLKRTIRLILTSEAYQLPAVGMQDPSEGEYVFRGPVVRRLSAEQFCDAVSQLVGAGYTSAAPAIDGIEKVPSKWLWSDSKAATRAPAETIFLRKVLELEDAPLEAAIAASCDNECTIYINGVEVGRSDDWKKPLQADVTEHLVKGTNVIAVAARNFAVADPSKNNPAAFRAVLSVQLPNDRLVQLGTDASWEVAAIYPAHLLLYDAEADEEWVAASELQIDENKYKAASAVLNRSPLPRHRAVWARNDPLMTALGRPNREQVVTYRPTAATTLEALELTNGQTLADRLERGAKRWMRMPADSDAQRIEQLYVAALGRPPTAAEQAIGTEMLGTPATAEGMADLLWAVLMMPEFQLIY